MPFQNGPHGGNCPYKRTHGLCAVSFGLGMALASICPSGLVLFLSAVILVSLGITVVRH